MTKESVEYILDLLNESPNVKTPFLSAQYITLSDQKFPSVDQMRFCFDTDNEILECYYVDPYSGDIPDIWEYGKNYDTIDGRNYKYLFNSDTLEPYVDYYSFDIIQAIGIKGDDE